MLINKSSQGNDFSIILSCFSNEKDVNSFFHKMEEYDQLYQVESKPQTVPSQFGLAVGNPDFYLMWPISLTIITHKRVSLRTGY